MEKGREKAMTFELGPNVQQADMADSSCVAEVTQKLRSLGTVNDPGVSGKVRFPFG